MSNHKPFTPLPWHKTTLRLEVEDCPYIAHSANAYPRLISILQELRPLLAKVPPFPLDGKFMEAEEKAINLLRELGEDV